MGSFVEITVDLDRPEAQLRDLLARALHLVEDEERELSEFLPLSELRRVNREASARAVPVREDLLDLLALAAEVSRETEGAFDPTVGPLLRCWGVRESEGRIPTEAELAEARERVGMEHVILDREAQTVRFARPGMELGFGAVGKGWVVRRVVELLRSEEVARAAVNAGGSTIHALGTPPDDARGWPTAVRPGGSEEPPLGLIRLQDRAFSTSGDHRHRRRVASRTVGHLVDPRSGEPLGGVRGACSCGWDAARSDALATAFAVMSPEACRAFCAKHREHGILIHEDREGAEAVETLGDLSWERAVADD